MVALGTLLGSTPSSREAPSNAVKGFEQMTFFPAAAAASVIGRCR
jgi:hypothetical protein